MKLLCFSFVITTRLGMGMRGWIYIAWENFGLVIWHINALAEYFSSVLCIRGPYTQTSTQAKLLDKQRLSVTQHPLFSLDIQSLISYQVERYLEQWKIIFHFHFSQLKTQKWPGNTQLAYILWFQRNLILNIHLKSILILTCFEDYIVNII